MRDILRRKLLSTALLAVTWCALPVLAAQDSYGLGKGTQDLTVLPGDTETINHSTEVTENLSAGSKFIQVSSTANFKEGSLVMVYQAKGLTSEVSKGIPSVKIHSGSVGRWELVRLSTRPDWDKLYLESPLSFNYAKGATQVILVPEYRDVTVMEKGTLTATEWSEATRTGGVLAFLANGTVTINGKVDMSGRGFPGGESGRLTCPTTATAPGGKGIADVADKDGARLANGGGGGRCSLAGGGGGGSSGHGGQGGYADPNAPHTQSVGVGGVGLDLGQGHDFLTHLILGGGGGAGHSTEASIQGKGGAGGGIIFIRGNMLKVSETGSITANGTDGTVTMKTKSVVAKAGGNGGGAGGSLHLRLTSSVQCVQGAKLEAKGGLGTGTVVSRQNNVSEFLGPGGGGGGGFARLQYSKVEDDGRCDVNVLNGRGGQPDSAPEKGDENLGARAGGNGKFVDIFVPAPEVTTPADNLNTGASPASYTGTISPSLLKPNVSIEVYVDDQLEGSVPVGESKSWELKARRSLTPGPHKVYAVVVDKDNAAESGPSKVHAFTLDTTPPKVTVLTPTQGLRTQDTLIEYTGTVSDDVSDPSKLKVMIRVDDGPEVAATVTVSKTGHPTWSYKSTERLAHRAHTVTAIATDESNNTGTDAKEFTVYAVSTGGNGTTPTPSVSRPDRNFYGDGVACAASGGAPSALAMMGLAALAALLARRRQR